MPALPGSVAGSAVRPHHLRPSAPPLADPFRKVRHLCLTSPGLFFSSRRVEKNSPGLFVNTSPTMILSLPTACSNARSHSLHHAPPHIFAPAFQKVRKRFGRNRRLAYLCTRKNAQGAETCGNSSVGRAQPCQGWGREFESRFPLTHVIEAKAHSGDAIAFGRNRQQQHKIIWRGCGIGRRATLRG